MGSFNVTCAISNAPIIQYQEAYMFWVASNPFVNSKNRDTGYNTLFQGIGCYPWDNFQVLGLPMLGEYQDYNNFGKFNKVVEEINLRQLNRLYVPNIPKRKDGQELPFDWDNFNKKDYDYNEYHDHVFIRELESIEQAQNLEHSGALRGKLHRLDTHIARVFIHKDIVNKLILTGTRTEGWAENKRTFTFEDDVNHLYTLLTMVEDDITNPLDSMDLSDMSDDEIRALRRALRRSSRSTQLSNERFDWQVDYHSLVDEEHAMEVARGLTITKWVSQWMYEHNKQWCPVVSSGQEWDFHASANSLNEIANVIREIHNPFENEESVPFTVTTAQPVTSVTVKELIECWKDWYLDDDLLNELTNEVLTITEPTNLFRNGGNKLGQLLEKHYMLPSHVSDTHPLTVMP